MKFSSNIYKSINIVEYQIHLNDTHSSYDNKSYNILMDIRNFLWSFKI
jgi:hypothetical protein